MSNTQDKKEDLEQMLGEYKTKLKSRYSDGRKRKSKLYGCIKQSSKQKLKVLDFYNKHGRWPKRFAKCNKEARLGTSFENYISKKSTAFDPDMRKLAMSTGRISNNKRDHNVKMFKNEILSFIAFYGRVPTTHAGESITGEGTLRSKLDYYTHHNKGNDTSFLGEIYGMDKCHKSGIPARFRKTINQCLEIEKPLIRMSNKDLNSDS